MRFSVPFALFVLIAFWGHSQNNAFYPTQVSKAAYFDKTPALIDMPVVEPGVRDRSWKDGLIENKSLGMGFNKNDQTHVDPSTLQGFMGSRTAKGPVVNVPGTGNVNGVYPPDTDGDVGPDHYFQMINLSFAIFDKEGNKLYGPVDNSTLWSGFPGPWSGTNDGDPIILYDEMAGRWVASQFAIYTSNNKYYEMIAVSETGDPLGAWNRYAFEFSLFPDYPKLSVWPDGYYATFHMFGSGFEGTGVAVFEREKMLAGNPDASMIYFGEYSNKFGFLPSDVDGDAPAAGTPNYVTGINFDGNKNMEIWELHANWQNPNNSTFSLAKTLTPASFNANINGIAQPGTSNKLDAISSVLMFRLPFRDFGSYRAMVANHTVNVSGRAGVRWYELRDNGTGWTIYQQGTYAPGAENRWMGSIAMAANGNIALGYSVSGSNVYPSIRYTGRTPNAPLGEMNLQEIEIIAGGSSQTGINRWGDYSCMAVDPYTDTTFWFTTEYMKSAGWGTRIASFDFSTIEQPTAYAGQDTAICENELFITQGNATNYASVLWETSGDGVFQNATSVNAKYLRGNQDIENGSVTLTLNVTGYLPGQEAGDEMELTITKEAEANAGPDQTINEDETAFLSGSAENYVTVHWSSSGDGAFSGNNALETEYTPGTNDIASGAVELSLQAYPGPGCPAAEDIMTLTINEVTAISNNPGNDLFKIVPNPSDGLFSISFNMPFQGEIMVVVRDLLGTEVWKQSYTAINSGKAEPVNLSRLPKGIYFIGISIGENNFVQKILIR